VSNISYSIAGGADAGLFTIDASTGALAFAAAPDFEAPADAGANNVYDVTVQASDGTLTDTQAIAVSVTNVAESSGNDTYQFSLAAGNNTIVDAGGTDAIAINGTPVTSLNFERVGNDLVIDANSTHITVSGHYAGSGNGVESISFTGGGSVYGYALGTGSYTLATAATGGNADDVVAGTSVGDVLGGGGGGGDDLLFGNASNDSQQRAGPAGRRCRQRHPERRPAERHLRLQHGAERRHQRRPHHGLQRERGGLGLPLERRLLGHRQRRPPGGGGLRHHRQHVDAGVIADRQLGRQHRL
jgi:hypothetical protein